jgi:hypothetical protein
MKKSGQSGFAVIEAVLVLVIVGILGFTGYFVWHAKQSTDKSLDNTAKSQPATAKKSSQQATPDVLTGEAANWLEYISPNKEYSMRLADGWKLNHCKGTPYLYTYIHSDISPKPGTKAVVSDIDCGSDGGGDGLSISFVTKASETTTTNPKTGSFKTLAGDTVNSYSRVEDSAEGGLGAVNKGGVYYTYILNKSSSKNMVISYGVNPGQADDHATVEQSIKTITIN